MIKVEVVGLVVAIRTVLPERRNGCHDQAGVHFPQRLVIEPQALHLARRAVFDQDVSIGDKLSEDAAPVGRIEIQRDAELVAV